MSRAGRVVVVGLAVGLGLAADSTGGVKARRCKRDFPTFSKCPVHTGEVASSDSLVFTAQRSNATLTFLACDDRFGAPPDGSSSIDLSIDDLIVVDRAFFNANLIPYPGDRPEDLEAYRVDRSTDACYNNNPPVAEVFRREAATAPSATMPLYERFEGCVEGLDARQCHLRPRGPRPAGRYEQPRTEFTKPLADPRPQPARWPARQLVLHGQREAEPPGPQSRVRDRLHVVRRRIRRRRAGHRAVHPHGRGRRRVPGAQRPGDALPSARRPVTSPFHAAVTVPDALRPTRFPDLKVLPRGRRPPRRTGRPTRAGRGPSVSPGPGPPCSRPASS